MAVNQLAILIIAAAWLVAASPNGQAQLTDDAANTPVLGDTIQSSPIFPLQGKHVHSSSIVELPDGSLLAAWFHGSGERKADDVCIFGARKPNAEAAWSEPFVLADTPGHPDCNPVLWVDNDQQLWLFWSSILSNEWGSALVKYRVSNDYLTADTPPRWQWQDTVHVKPENLQSEMLNSWPQLLSTVTHLPRAIQAEASEMTWLEFLQKEWDMIAGVLCGLALINFLTYRVHLWRKKSTGLGGWRRLIYRSLACYGIMALMGFAVAHSYLSIQSGTKLNRRLGWLTANAPLQLETGEIILPLYSDRFGASLMAISEDGGRSWEASQSLSGYGCIQPTLLQRSNGQIVAMMRENGARKRIRFSVSDNGGRNWSEVLETDLPNPGSKVNMTALKDGRWVLAYNDLLDGRHVLSLAVSNDEGANWAPFKVIESAAPGDNSFSYPCLYESSDARLHLTYSCSYRDGQQHAKTIKHVSLSRPVNEANSFTTAESKRGVFR